MIIVITYLIYICATKVEIDTTKASKPNREESKKERIQPGKKKNMIQMKGPLPDLSQEKEVRNVLFFQNNIIKIKYENILCLYFRQQSNYKYMF